MARTAPFDTHHQRYDAWFERHAAAYQSELLAVRALLPWEGLGLSIGVGTGRFAAPLGVQMGIDPAREVLPYAQARGISVVRGTAEALPFADASFERILSVTTLCFVDDAIAMLAEAYRVLRPGGALVLGIIDRDSTLGQHYLAHQAENIFYRDASFYSGDELQDMLRDGGFGELEWLQTLSQPLPAIREIEPLRPGRGQAAFVVVRGRRPEAVPST
jgi:SAM-dependent methyltransferase